jgi:hypothetical protein
MFGGDLDLSDTIAVEYAVLKAVEEVSPVKHLGE